MKRLSLFGMRRMSPHAPHHRSGRFLRLALPLSLTLMGGGLGAYVGATSQEATSVWGALLGLAVALAGAGSTGYSLGATREHIRVLTKYRLIGENRPNPIPPWCTKCWIHCAVTEGEFNE